MKCVRMNIKVNLSEYQQALKFNVGLCLAVAFHENAFQKRIKEVRAVSFTMKAMELSVTAEPSQADELSEKGKLLLQDGTDA